MKIKNCPFCGREISIEEVCSVDNQINGNGVHSLGCCAEMTWEYLLDGHCHKNSVNRKSKTKLKLIDKWNKRVAKRKERGILWSI